MTNVELVHEIVMPGVVLTVDYKQMKATLTLGAAVVAFDWNDDARMIFDDLEGACPIELLAILANVAQFSSAEQSGMLEGLFDDE